MGRMSEADSALSGKNTGKPRTEESTGIRMEIWKAAFHLIREHPIAGSGTGDVKDALMEQYRERNLVPVYSKKLNAHNQYIQTFVALGLPGFLILVAMLVTPFFSAFRRKEYLYISFLMIFGFSILFESMLETQAGVVFYAMFNTMLFITGREDVIRDTEKVVIAKR